MNVKSVLFLWGIWGTYMEEVADALRENGVDVTVIAEATAARSPHDVSRWQSQLIPPTSMTASQIRNTTIERQVDAVLISGWQHHQYLDAVTAPLDTTRILCMDNQWKERPKQWAARVGRGWLIQKYFDAAFVPGERQYQFARRLGFSQQQIAQGLLIPSRHVRPVELQPLRTGFLYVGAREEGKGFASLMEAYKQYRRLAGRDAWRLTIAGAGAGVEGPGVTDAGFVADTEVLRTLYTNNRCTVLIGACEAWGVVLTEAAQASHILISSAEVGATPHVVQNLYNGFVVPGADVPATVGAMFRTASLPLDVMDAWSERSRQIVAPYTGERWCASLQDLVARL